MDSECVRNPATLAMEDYYSTLGLPRSATKKDIRAAYLQLVQKYHPDHNPTSKAAEFTVRLNEAYSVLFNDDAKKQYDSWLASAKQEPSEDTSRSRQEPIPEMKCSSCGRQDATLRLSLMHYTISILLVTYRRGASGIWCERCRFLQAAKWSFLTGVAGWWGVPWGPIYTIQALFVNASGGKQPAKENASVLRVLGYQLYSKGRYAEAANSLRKSVALEHDTGAHQLLSYLDAQVHQQTRGWSMWGFYTALPSMFVVGLVIAVVTYLSSSPSGYAANYQPPPAIESRSVPRSDPARERVNSLIGQLAGIVEAHAPIVGTHYEGQTKIQDHVLDRSKFEPSEIRSIASQIRSAMHGTPDPNGFLSSALFNAEMLGLSIEIVNGIDNGLDINAQIDEVEALQTDPLISSWLEKSRFAPAYSQLCAKLAKYRRQYHPGTATASLSQEYAASKESVRELKAQLETYENQGDNQSYNSLVPEYNSEVAAYNNRLKRLRTQATISQKLDLGFNKCLDSSILMSKFQKVELASHETEVTSLPEPE
jgi:hypothetical protein